MAILSIPGVNFTPSPKKEVTSSNYLEASNFNFTNQYMPDLYEKEFQSYGNQSIKGFLEKQGSEYAISSDLVKWTEEGRLTKVYKAATRTGNVFSGTSVVGHSVRVNETVLIYNTVTGVENIGIVTDVAADNFTAVSTLAAGFGVGTTAGQLTIYVYGSEFRKGTLGQATSLTTDPNIFENSPVIIKDVDIVNGSDMTQIGWIEVAPEYGGGYLWYLKDRAKTRQRFDDMLEMALIEGKNYETASGAKTAGYKGTEGFFDAVSKGNIFEGVISDIETDYESVINRLDSQGAIAENLMFAKRNQDLAFDKGMAALNATYAGGANYGIFENDVQKAIALSFKSIMWGGYTFHKTAWKYLNDPTKRGAITGLSAINGVICPAGSMSVYDNILGANTTLPFMHIKYRSNSGEDRRYKALVVGGAGGATTSSLDANELHLLSERCLTVMGRNNFVLLKSSAA